jgi:hypothetical protein
MSPTVGEQFGRGLVPRGGCQSSARFRTTPIKITDLAPPYATLLYIMSDQDIELPSRRDAMVGGRPAAVRELDGFAHVLWRDGKLYYSLVSNQPAARLIPVAQAIAMATASPIQLL